MAFPCSTGSVSLFGGTGVDAKVLEGEGGFRKGWFSVVHFSCAKCPWAKGGGVIYVLDRWDPGWGEEGCKSSDTNSICHLWRGLFWFVKE